MKMSYSAVRPARIRSVLKLAKIMRFFFPDLTFQTCVSFAWVRESAEIHSVQGKIIMKSNAGLDFLLF